MRYKLLGKSGLRVSELVLGTMTFGEEPGWGVSKGESRRIFEVFVNAGGNFIDAANRAISEEYLGEFVKSDREHFVLATKYTLSTVRNDPNASGNHRKNMVQSLEASLRRLSTSYIDLYWVQAWDFMSPVEEVMRALDDMVRAGKILYIGIADTPAWVVSQANTMAELQGWSPFIGLQIQYSLIERSAERDLLPMARAFDIGVITWGALGSGFLTGRYDERRAPAATVANSQDSERDVAIRKEVSMIAEDQGRTVSQVALNWERQQPGVIIPVIGASKAAHIKDDLACLEFALNEKQMRRLDEVSRIELGFPHDFLASEDARDVVYGGVFSKIDNHRRDKGQTLPFEIV